ncbi:MAG: sensor histidine kinase [Bacteroidales bacterium]
MKLLTRTSAIYLIIAGIVMIAGGLVFYNLLSNIFYSQIDKTLYEERLLVEETINYSDTVPDFRLILGHHIDVTLVPTPQKKAEMINDTVMYDKENGDFESFRHLLVRSTSMQHQGYVLNLYKPLREKEALIAEIMIAVSLVFVSLLVALVFFNYFISRRVWVPFYRTLQKLGTYDINQENLLEFTPTGIHEFTLLNQALEKMSGKIRKDFLNLKEFNENASHELQTPLAVIKSKLDLLVQEENLSEDQMQQLSAIYDATTRMSKLNQGLLLISKIENNQFSLPELIRFENLIDNTLENFREMTDHKSIVVKKEYTGNFIVNMNRVLAEVLVTNLVSNAIRHNVPGGIIRIETSSAFMIIRNSGNPLSFDPTELFKRFRKSEQKSESVGLGLSIVSRIASLYKLEIGYSRTGEFHVFRISLEE